MKYDTIKDLKSLPVSVQKKVAEMVGGYFGTDAVVTREYGEFDVGSCVCLKNHYGDDHKTWHFCRSVVEQDDSLKKIVLAQDAESERWEKNEGKNFDWEAFMQ